jgi:hypothetical protein
MITKDQLVQQGKYQVSEELHIDDFGKWLMATLKGEKVEFDKKEIKKFNFNSWKTLIIFVVSAFVGYFLGKAIANFFLSGYGGGWWMFIFIFPILIIHELIHGLGYYLVGANKVKYGGNASSGMIYAYSDYFVLNMNQFKFVAFLPFFIITLCLIILLFVLPAFTFGISTLLILHTTMCFGDFALIKYAFVNPDHLTLDEIEVNKKIYFFKPVV